MRKYYNLVKLQSGEVVGPLRVHGTIGKGQASGVKVAGYGLEEIG
jgi:hypothetical protein